RVRYVCPSSERSAMPVGGVRLLSVNCYEQIPTWPKVLGRHCKFLMGLVGENRRLSRPGMPSSPRGRRFKSDPRNHQAEHLCGVQQAFGARLDDQPSPFCKSQLRKSAIAVSESDSMECKVLRGGLAHDLLADRAHPQTMAGISDAHMPERLSQ